jgi:hypothetical protein
MEDIEGIEALANMASVAEKLEAGEQYASAEDVLESEKLSEAQEQLRLMMENLKAARQGTGIQIHYSVYILAFVTIFSLVG